MKKIFLTLVCIGLLLQFVTACEEQKTNSIPSLETTNQEETAKEKTNNISFLQGKVLFITDGDSIKVKLENGSVEKVRMILVNTPEMNYNKPQGPQPFAKEAKDFTTKFLSNKTVKLELGVQERDPFGRLLAYVYVDGKMFQKELLKEGLARIAVYPPNTKYLDELREIEKKSKQQGKNIWSIENYVIEEEKGFNG